jgi:phage terminase small subunit
MAGTYRSGRRAVPTAIHVLRGTGIKGRKDEPQVPLGRPEIPPAIQVDPVALAHWEHLVERLEGMRVLNAGHGPALALLAHTLADQDRVRAELHAMNYQQLIIDRIPNPKTGRSRRKLRENPLIRRSERLALLVARLLGDFGLTPVTQTKVHAQIDTPQTRAQRYLGG